MLQSLQAKLHEYLSAVPDVSLTCDIWTDRRSHAYLGVTVHSFHDGKPESHLLAFQTFAGSHTGQKIADSLETIISDNNITSKIRSVVTDNASNMRRAMTVLLEDSASEVDDPSLWEDQDDAGDLLSAVGVDCQHVSCFAHSLQLVVHDGLGNLTAARSLIAKCSKLANLIHQSALFRSAYEAALGSGKIVPSSNETRWNSTLRQLQCIANLDQPTLNALLRDTNHENLILTVKDSSLLQELVQILTPFAEATDLTQGQKMVTISCVVPILLSLNNLLELAVQNTSVYTSFIQSLLASLRGRFSSIYSLLGFMPLSSSIRSKSTSFSSTSNCNLFLMAAAMDPAFAFHWLQDLPGDSEQREAMQNKITGN